jgi:hypothetical protein
MRKFSDGLCKAIPITYAAEKFMKTVNNKRTKHNNTAPIIQAQGLDVIVAISISIIAFWRSYVL